MGRSGGVGDSGLAELRAAVERAQVSAPAVSAWSVGMHVHHCALATIGMCRALVKSTPPAPPNRFSIARAVVFTTGWIPRGRGKSHEAALPRADVTAHRLRERLDEAERMLGEAAGLSPGAWFEHFVLGNLDRDRTLRFIRIHDRHHLRIIDDVLVSATR